jgi:hypothetical protein
MEVEHAVTEQYVTYATKLSGVYWCEEISLILFNKKQTMFRVVYEQIADEPIP